MNFTLSGAAKEAGVSKSTLSKALNTGRLSGERLEDGSFRIDAAELFRVFPKSTIEKGDDPFAVTVRERVKAAGELPLPELVLLQFKVQMLEEQLGRERDLRNQERETSQETVLDLRKRLDRSEERVLALTAVRNERDPPTSVSAPVEVSVASATPKPRGGFLARLLDRT